MRAETKIFWISVFLIAALVAAFQVFQHRPGSKNEKARVEFLAHFYKGYLSHSRSDGGQGEAEPARFYSRAASSLLAANAAMCKSMSRGDEICGYGADGDVILGTQEVAPDLTYESSRFTARPAGPNAVDVSFTVWPGQEGSQRDLRYVLVEEDGQWKVDDVFFGEDGKFPVESSMRYLIVTENAMLEQNARNFSEAWQWISVYLQESMMDRFSRFVAFPVEICDGKGICALAAIDDARYIEAFGAVRGAYPGNKATMYLSGKPAVNRPPGTEVLARPADGATRTKGAFEFVFRNKLWWIRKIDARRAAATWE
jgi:hypothetical protein